MLIKRNLRVFLALIAMMSLSVVSAAELRGQLSYDSQQLNGPVVTVFCRGIQTGETAIGASGNYAVRGLPAGQDCSFQVSAMGAISKRIPFSTTRSVTIYSGKLRIRNDKILVLKQ